MVHEAVVKYEKALSMEMTAREMVDVTEKDCEAKRKGPGLRSLVWLEMVNHATNKVSECETSVINIIHSLSQGVFNIPACAASMSWDFSYSLCTDFWRQEWLFKWHQSEINVPFCFLLLVA